MNNLISGLQHVGIGVPDAVKARRQYYALHHMQIQLVDVVNHADYLRAFSGGEPVLRRLIYLMNLGGGGGFHLIQLQNQVVSLPEKNIAFGQPGINAVFLRCFSPDFVAANHKHFHIPLLQLTNPLQQTIWHAEDLYDNRFRFVPGDQPFGPGEMASGGVAGAMIGTQKMAESIQFYQQVLGFEKLLYDVTGQFADLPGASKKTFRRVLLYRAPSSQGPFSRMQGDACVELIEELYAQRLPHFYTGRNWGQPGFLHLAFETADLAAFAEQFTEAGRRFLIPPTEPVAFGKVVTRFAFCQDPDGTPIGFVQTLELPLLKALGWKIKPRNQRPIANWKLGLLNWQKIGAKELAK